MNLLKSLLNLHGFNIKPALTGALPQECLNANSCSEIERGSAKGARSRVQHLFGMFKRFVGYGKMSISYAQANVELCKVYMRSSNIISKNEIIWDLAKTVIFNVDA